MKKAKKALSVALAAAMVITGSGISGLATPGTASAAKKASVKFKKTSCTVEVGKKVTVKLKKTNIRKIKSQKWTSSRKAVATVSKKGVVTAVAAGKTVVKCKVTYLAKGSSKKKTTTLKCKIKVVAAAAQTTAPTAAPVVPSVAPSLAPSVAPSVAPTAAVSEAPSQEPAESVYPVVTHRPQTDATPYPVKDVPSEEPRVTNDPGTHSDNEVIKGVVNSSNATLKMPYEDTSNNTDQPITTTVPGASREITIKDNGSMRRELSAQYLQTVEMGTGFNLGNTLEGTYSIYGKLSVINGTDETKYDNAWIANANVSEKYFEKLHSYGINTVRIPVAWSNGDSDDGTYTIDEKLLARVEEVANYALNQGMYVIINDHWDNQWWGGFGACYRDGSGKHEDTERRKQTWIRYERYWTQIAERFKNYSDHLILESANEELGERLNDKISIYTGYSKCTNDSEFQQWAKLHGIDAVKDESCGGNLTDGQCYDIANQINQKFVDIIRNSGGNNEYRHLLIAGIDTNIVQTCMDTLSYKADEDGDGVKETITKKDPFKMPEDISENGVNKLFVSIHYYTPWDFCGDNGTGNYTYGAQAKLESELSPLQKFVDQGYAVIMGEGGICSPGTVDGSVTQWFEDTFAMARKYHTVPVMWETGQYFDRNSGDLKYRDVAEFLNAVNVNSKGEYANGDTSMTRVTGKIDTSLVLRDVSGKTPVWSWEGIWYKNGGDSAIGSDRYSANPDIASDDSQYVAASKTTTTIDGDTTSIEFSGGGYQSFIHLDYSKYTDPIVVVKFADETLNPDNYKSPGEDNVGRIQLGVASNPNFSESLGLAFKEFDGKGIDLDAGDIMPGKISPYLSLTFSGRPTVTGIYIYEGASK